MTITELPTEASPLTDLRRPFPDTAVGKLPRVTCRACRDGAGGVCASHDKRQCPGCGNYMTSAHIHLDYVGHAEVTDRLLTADLAYKWEPQYRDVDPHLMAQAIETGNPEMVRLVVENSPPKFERNGNGDPVGLWINLTVAGVTRPGYGSLDRAKSDGEKELIGDALRNAAMRFGVALNLWSKTELESQADETPAAAPPVPADEGWKALGYTDAEHLKDVNDPLHAMWRSLHEDQRPAVKQWLKDQGYTTPVPVHKDHADAYHRLLSTKLAEELANPPGQTSTEPTQAGGASTPPEATPAGSATSDDEHELVDCPACGGSGGTNDFPCMHCTGGLVEKELAVA